MSIWIFGENLGPNTSPGQINLIAPEHAWNNEMVDVQVIRKGRASAKVPVPFGVNRPILSLAETAFAGRPVWLHIEMPFPRNRLRYPHWTAPWDIAPGRFEVRFAGRRLAVIPKLPLPLPVLGSMMIALPHEPAERYLDRAPLHLVYAFNRPGTYEVRYTETLYDPRTQKEVLCQQSDWTAIKIRPSTSGQRAAWLTKLAASAPSDPIEAMADYLPSLLAVRDENVLRIVARYLDPPDQILRTYAQYALNYFDPALLHRVVPGRKPLTGAVI